MTAELKESVEKLRSLSPKLNSVTEQANRVVQLVETFLNEECKAGLPCYEIVWTKMPEHDQYADLDDYEGLLLGYDRVGGRFRIVIQSNEDAYDDDTEKVSISKRTVPWSDSPRSEKLQSFRHLPSLMKRIALAIETTIKSTDETAKTVEEIMDAINAPIISGQLNGTIGATRATPKK